MQGLSLDYPVHTLEGKQLLPAGTMITEDAIDAMIKDRPPSTFSVIPFLQYGSFRKDLLIFLGEPPYDFIFGEKDLVAHLIELGEGVCLPMPLLQALEYFQQQDFYTYRHMLMVFALSTLLAVKLIDDSKQVLAETIASPTHDIGKICVPLSILTKTTPLTMQERNLLHHHAMTGYVLLSYYNRKPLNLAARIARDHHERNNGCGYPRGIQLQDQMVEIVVASDVYDALISPRPYRSSSYSNRGALEKITDMALEGQLGWPVVQALISSNRYHYQEYRVSLEKREAEPKENFYGKTVPDENGPDNQQ